jgi:hypothetical protein
MTDDTDAFEFLERLEITSEDVVTKEIFAAKLKSRFDRAGMGKPTEKQIDVMFQSADTTFLSFPNSGITRIVSQKFSGKNTRFGIQGQRGLFGIAKAIKFLRFGKF